MKKSIISIMLAISLVLFAGCSIIDEDSLAAKGIVPFLIPTTGTEILDDGTITMTTDVDGNRFGNVRLQLYTVEEKYIDDISSSQDGTSEGIYTHWLETGEYILTLRGNTNVQDERAYTRVYLIHGKTYRYTYTVTTLEEKLVVIKDYSFKLS